MSDLMIDPTGDFAGGVYVKYSQNDDWFPDGMGRSLRLGC